MPEGKRILRLAFKRLEHRAWFAFGRRTLHLGRGILIPPGLGIWMLPLGLLIGSDVPSPRKPVGRFTI